MADRFQPVNPTKTPFTGDYYSYGQGPEFDFFNTIPTEPEVVEEDPPVVPGPSTIYPPRPPGHTGNYDARNMGRQPSTNDDPSGYYDNYGGASVDQAGDPEGGSFFGGVGDALGGMDGWDIGGYAAAGFFGGPLGIASKAAMDAIGIPGMTDIARSAYGAFTGRKDNKDDVPLGGALGNAASRYGYTSGAPRTGRQPGYSSFGGWANSAGDALRTGWYGNPNQNPNRPKSGNENDDGDARNVDVDVSGVTPQDSYDISGIPDGASMSVGSGGSSGGGGCFITTATCEHMGKADDCDELNVLRWFRDNVLKDDPRVAEYYDIAPEIVAKLNAMPNAKQIYTDIYEGFIAPAVKAIDDGKYDDADSIYTSLVSYAKELTT